MLPETAKRLLSKTESYIRALLRNPYWWGGLILLTAFLGTGYVLVNDLLMPKLTRQGAHIQVPNVINRPYDQARNNLEALGLHVERIVQQYNPAFARDVVVDQNPSPSALVKPDRHVYLTINSGELRHVVVSDVVGLSLREAVNRLRAQGLHIEETLPDSIPAPNRNTVTGQEPAAGDTLTEGASVSLWYSTGLGIGYSTIPDITGLGVHQAQDSLLSLQLRSIVISAPDSLSDPNAPDSIVLRQSPAPGMRVRAGFEVRLHTWRAEQPEPDRPFPFRYEENEPPGVGL